MRTIRAVDAWLRISPAAKQDSNAAAVVADVRVAGEAGARRDLEPIQAMLGGSIRSPACTVDGANRAQGDCGFQRIGGACVCSQCSKASDGCHEAVADV